MSNDYEITLTIKKVMSDDEFEEAFKKIFEDGGDD